MEKLETFLGLIAFRWKFEDLRDVAATEIAVTVAPQRTGLALGEAYGISGLKRGNSANLPTGDCVAQNDVVLDGRENGNLVDVRADEAVPGIEVGVAIVQIGKARSIDLDMSGAVLSALAVERTLIP